MPDQFVKYLTAKAGLEEAMARELTSGLPVKAVSKGAYLLKEGEVCRHSFFVAEGLLRGYTVDGAGKEHIIQFAPEDWFITDRSSVYFGAPSDFFIDAIEASSVVVLDQSFWDRASGASASFRKFNDKLLHNHIRHLQKRVSLLIGASAEQHYLYFIELYPDLMLRVPQWMIASYLGITPESLSRVRKDLASRYRSSAG